MRSICITNIWNRKFGYKKGGIKMISNEVKIKLSHSLEKCEHQEQELFNILMEYKEDKDRLLEIANCIEHHARHCNRRINELEMSNRELKRNYEIIKSILTATVEDCL